MKIFNIGALEFLFILLIAFIVLGPKKAVKFAGDLGRWLRNLTKSPAWREFKAVSKDINDIPKKIMRDADMQKTLEELDRTAYGIDHALNNTEFHDDDKTQESEPMEGADPGDIEKR